MGADGVLKSVLGMCVRAGSESDNSISAQDPGIPKSKVGHESFGENSFFKLAASRLVQFVLPSSSPILREDFVRLQYYWGLSDPFRNENRMSSACWVVDAAPVLPNRTLSTGARSRKEATSLTAHWAGVVCFREKKRLFGCIFTSNKHLFLI